jgi:D-alanine-D-alanine ligase-like ATP-grasp enzyme
MLYSLVYVSSAVTLFSSAELVALLDQSRANNARLGISGMLLYKDGNTMQLLEGERDAVLALYERIAVDPRHRGVLRLLEGPTETRLFADWSMAFHDLNAPDAGAIPGYSEFLNTPLTGAEFSANPTRCQKLLTTFKRAMSGAKPRPA